MDKKKRSRKVGLLVCLLIPLLIYFLIIYTVASADRVYYMEQFEEERQAFEYVADYVVELSEQYEKTNMRISVCPSNGKRIFRFTNNEEIIEPELNNELRENIDRIEEAFANFYWEKILITTQGVSFSIEGNNIAFIYTFDGKSPNYMNSPEEKFDIKSWSLGDGWYYVTPR